MPLPARTPELGVLDLLVSVADTGSLGRAAALHRISQPAASQRIQRLERRLGLPLLVRTATGSRLTPAGEAVLGWARRLVEQAEQFAVAVEALRGDAADVLRVAASLTVADYVFPAWLAELHRLSPASRVSLRVGNSAAVVDLVRQGATELGFIETPHPPPGLGSRAVGGDRLVVVVSPDHRWSRRRRPLPLDALAAEPLVVREPGSGTREALEEVLTGAGLELHPAVELGSTAAVRSAAMNGEGPAVLSALSVTAELGDGRLRAVELAGTVLHRPFRAIWHPERPPAGAAVALLAAAGRSTPAADPD
jgi:DNA-binding transcriptional LysR family regulator